MMVPRISLLSAALLALSAHAAEDVLPEPGPARPLVVPAFQEATLPNGVRVVVAPRTGLPLVTVALQLRAGAAMDPPGKAGLAELTAQLRTKGATVDGKPLPATDLAARAEALGGALESTSGWRGNVVAMTVTTPQLAEAAKLVAATVRAPLLQAAELDRLRTQTADALVAAQADPMQLAGWVARRAAWGASVYGGTLTPHSLGRIRLADIQAAQSAQNRPDLATLVVTGDVTLEAATHLAQTLLGDWKAPRMAPPRSRNEAAAPRTPATTVIDFPGAGQSGVIVMAPSVGSAAPERHVARVATAVLGGGYSARLNSEVRIKRGLSYGATASLATQPVGGFVIAATQTKNPTAAEAAQVMQGELLRLGQDAPGEAELAARKAALIGGIASGIETNAGLATLALANVAEGRPLDDTAQSVPLLQAVTAEQVQAYAKAHWTATSLRTVVVGDVKEAGKSLPALDAKALRLKASQVKLDQATLR